MIRLNPDWNSPMKEFLSKMGLVDEVKKLNIPAISIPRCVGVKIAPPKELIKLEISSVKEIHSFFEKIKDDEILKVDDNPIVLYIKWSRMINESSQIENLPRLHLINCCKIKEMRLAGRINRYVATSDTSGVFDLLTSNNKDVIKRPLIVCQACLNSIKKETPNAISDFKLNKPSNHIDFEGWFNSGNNSFQGKNLFSSHDMVTKGGYTIDWPEVSLKKRTSANWKCSECKVNLSNRKDLLDTHHIDGNPQNNADSNLAVLCRICHANQPMHSHMKDANDWKAKYRIIANIKSEQDKMIHSYNKQKQ